MLQHPTIYLTFQFLARKIIIKMKDKKISNCKIYCHPSTILIIEFVQVTQGKLLHISKYLLYFHGMTGIHIVYNQRNP